MTFVLSFGTICYNRRERPLVEDLVTMNMKRKSGDKGQ